MYWGILWAYHSRTGANDMRYLARLYRWFNSWDRHTADAGHGTGDMT